MLQRNWGHQIFVIFIVVSLKNLCWVLFCFCYALMIWLLVAIIQTFVFLRMIQQCFSNRDFTSDVQNFLDNLKRLKECFDENMLSMNKSKCELVNFGRYLKKIYCLGYFLKWQNNERYLGVLIDKK